MSKQTEYIKCYQDKSRAYFIENYLYTFNATERMEVPFKVFPRQRVFLNACAQNNNIVTRKHRQSGISTISSAFAIAQCVFVDKKSPETILCIANKLDQAEELLIKMKEFLDQVPRWMWGGEFYSSDPDNPKNFKSIYIKKNQNYVELFNGCKIYARASTPNAARGISAVSILILDEAAFLNDGVSAYTSAVSAMASASNAKVIMVSTPNGKDQLYYKTFSQAVKKENNFCVVEFKWFQDPRYNRWLKWYKKDDETGDVMWKNDPVIDKKGNIEYNEERWDELEKNGWTPTSPWYDKMCKTFNNDSQKIAQELEGSFLGSSDNVVPVDVIEFHRTQNVIKIDENWPLRDKFVEDTWIWKDPIPGHRYLCACDPSTGSGDDSTSIQVIDIDAIDEQGNPFFEQVLEYSGKLNGEQVAELIYRYGTSFNNALALVECIGGYGDAVVIALMNQGYPNIYYDDSNLRNYTSQIEASKFNKKAGDILPGFRSNGLRLQTISNFVEMLKNNSFRPHSMRVISELETWIFKNGRPDHMTSAHDDNLTCLAMGLFIAVYHMIRNERQKSKDVQIVKSWFMNSPYKTDYSSSRLKSDMSIEPDKHTYYLSGDNDFKTKNEEKSKMNAMLMLTRWRKGGAI